MNLGQESQRQFDVVLVDDNSSDTLIYEIAFRRSGLARSIKVFEDGHSAIDYLKQQDQPDIVFLDIHMPEMDGFEFLDEFAELPDERREGTRLYMISSSLDPSDKQRAEAHPLVDAFLGKPLTGTRLQHLLADG